MLFVLLLFWNIKSLILGLLWPVGAWGPYVLGVLPWKAALLWAVAVALLRGSSVYRDISDTWNTGFSVFYLCQSLDLGLMLANSDFYAPATPLPCLSVLNWWRSLGSCRALWSSLPLPLCDQHLEQTWLFCPRHPGSWSRLSPQVRRTDPERGWPPPGGAPRAGGVADNLWEVRAEGVRQHHLPAAWRLQVPSGGFRWVWRSLGALCPDKAVPAISRFSVQKQTRGSCQWPSRAWFCHAFEGLPMYWESLPYTFFQMPWVRLRGNVCSNNGDSQSVVSTLTSDSNLCHLGDICLSNRGWWPWNSNPGSESVPP